MVAGAGVGLVAVTGEGTLLLANPMAEQHLGPLMAGRPLTRVAGMAPVSAALSALAGAGEPARLPDHLVVDLPSGRRVMVAVSRLVGVRQPDCFLLVVRDDPRFGPALHDGFTGLLNRRGLLGHLEMLAENGGGVLALLDIDQMRQINHRHGHDAGDALIRAVASALSGAVPRPGVAARVGGNEFVALLPGLQLAQAEPHLHRILAAVTHPALDLPDGLGPLQVSVSVGAAALTHGRFPDRALQRAGDVLRVAKARGGGTVVLDGPQVQDWARDRSAMMSWLHQLHAENDVLRQQTLTDPLTGLPNPRALRHAEALLSGADYPVGVVFADLDRFGAYNHRYGDNAGDSALIAVAGCLAAGLRTGDQVFRKGGEEFVALLPGATPEVTAMVAERLRASVHDLGLPHADNPPTRLLTITAAVAATGPDTSPERARASAADLVYAAKLADQRNQVHHP